MGHKRVWPYRFEAQERALMAGMRGAGFLHFLDYLILEKMR